MSEDGWAGPEPAWDWGRLQAACARQARRIVGDAHDAEEAAQNAMVRGWRHRHTCRASDPLPWLLEITRMEAKRLLERRRARHARELPEVDDAALATTDDHDELLTRVDVERALRALTATDRALVTARYVDDLTQPAAAKRLGVPEGTAKVRLHRIRKRLRDVLEVEP